MIRQAFHHTGSCVRRSTMAAVVGLTTVAASAAQQPATDSLGRLTTQIERAVTSQAAGELKAMRAQLLRALAETPSGERARLTQYAIAYIAWRMADLNDVPEKERGELLDDAVERLQAVVKADPKHTEAYILLSAVYGAQVGRSAMQGMLLGPRSSSALERAAAIAPDNPRLALQEGIGAFNRPAMFGGGADKAERALRRSLDLFAREPVGKPWPNWGRVDAHAWLGQLLARRGDRAGARAEYDKALAIAPSRWVRFVLLPALEKSAKP